MVTATHDGRRRVVAATDAAARALGLHPGLPLAHAQALVPGLTVTEADAKDDEAALAALAAWCLLRYAPLTAPDLPDGIWLDVTGCTHIHGREEAMLADLVSRFARAGAAARAAVAETSRAAWVVAHFGGGTETAIVVPRGGIAEILGSLPIAALRLPEGICAALRRLGIDHVGQLAAAPRTPLARRFGVELLLRLDQALGRVAEPISPVVPRLLARTRRSCRDGLGAVHCVEADRDGFVTSLDTRPTAAAVGRAKGAGRGGGAADEVEVAVGAGIGAYVACRDALAEIHAARPLPAEGAAALERAVRGAVEIGDERDLDRIPEFRDHLVAPVGQPTRIQEWAAEPSGRRPPLTQLRFCGRTRRRPRDSEKARVSISVGSEKETAARKPKPPFSNPLVRR